MTLQQEWQNFREGSNLYWLEARGKPPRGALSVTEISVKEAWRSGFQAWQRWGETCVLMPLYLPLAWLGSGQEWEPDGLFLSTPEPLAEQLQSGKEAVPLCGFTIHSGPPRSLYNLPPSPTHIHTHAQPLCSCSVHPDIPSPGLSCHLTPLGCPHSQALGL